MLKVLAEEAWAGLAGVMMRDWVSVLVEGVRESPPSVFGCWFVVVERLGRVVGG